MALVAALPLVVWIGIFLYTLSMDRKLTKIEREQEINDL
jgi:CcmD family protein